MKKLIYLFLLLTVSFSCKDTERNSETKTINSAAQLYHNGDILTMDTEKPTYAEALVAEDGKIAFIGDKAKAEEKYANAKKIDLNGKTLLPGFIDPHSHFGMVSNTMGDGSGRFKFPTGGRCKKHCRCITKNENLQNRARHP